MVLQKRLRAVGLIILFFGLLLAALVYGARLSDDENDGDDFVSKREVMQMERIGGKAIVLASEVRLWFVGLWHGQKLAYTLTCLSVGGCGVCFFLARLWPEPSSSNDETAVN